MAGETGRVAKSRTRSRKSAQRLAEQAVQADVELARDQPDDAGELAAAELQPVDELLLGRVLERFARALDPARGGRAVNVVDLRELVEVEAVEGVLAQHEPLAIGELRERRLERELELVAVEALQVADLRIVVGCDQVRDLVVLGGGL